MEKDLVFPQRSVEVLYWNLTISLLTYTTLRQRNVYPLSTLGAGTSHFAGTTGDWKNHFSPELQEEVDKWIVENLAGTDISQRWALG